MTHEHLKALLGAAEAQSGSDGWSKLPEGRLLTLYVASGASTLSVGKVEALRLEGALLHARTSKGELFVLALSDVFAGAVEAPSAGGRRAGFT